MNQANAKTVQRDAARIVRVSHPLPLLSPIEGEEFAFCGACRGAEPLCVSFPPPGLGANPSDRQVRSKDLTLTKAMVLP